MKVRWTVQPSYETMQRLWKKHPEVEPTNFTKGYEGEVKQVLENTVIITDPGEMMEVEVSIDQIHF